MRLPPKKIDVIMEWSQSIYNVAKMYLYLRYRTIIMASAPGKK